MSSGTEHHPRGSTLVAEQASHVDAKFEAARTLCRRTLIESPELYYLGHYTEGVYDFSYDMLNGPSEQAGRLDYARTGGQITDAFRDLDRMLWKVKTGALIRTVVHGLRGLVICDSARPDEHVVGFSHALSALPAEGVALPLLPGAHHVDKAIALLVTNLREQVSLGSQDPGSWISAKPDDVELPLVDALAIRPHVEGTANQQVTRLFQNRVHPADLQFMAYCRNGQVEFLVDQFDHPQLGPYFLEISVIERRLFYQDVCRRFPMIIQKLGRIVVSVIEGRVERLVLDVEQGAIYYYRIRPAEYLVGVTIIQRKVAEADRKIAEISLACCGDSPVSPTDRCV